MNDEPLAGFTVGVTAARRREELSALLERRGARVVCAPAIRLVPLADDGELLDATRELLSRPVDDVVITAGVGFRAWLETVEGWGLHERLAELLGDARILTHGPRARGAVRAAGMAEAWSPASESWEEILRHLLEQDLVGRRIAIQLYGEPAPHLASTLRRAGAEVAEIPVYRWARTDDPTPLRRLVGQAVAGTVDAITFTSAPAVAATLAVAAEDNLQEMLLDALRSHVVTACVGPATAAPLQDRGVVLITPERARLSALVGALAVELPARRASRVAVHGHALERRGRRVGVLDEVAEPSLAGCSRPVRQCGSAAVRQCGSAAVR